MNALAPQNRSDIVRKAPRMRPALRQAVSLIVEQGLTQRAAAGRVGMNETSLGRALQRKDIAAYVESQKALLALDADKIKARGRSMALLVGIDLLHNAQSEAVRARMVEFFAGEARAAPSVSVTVNQNAGGGYEYVRPGQVIEIVEGKASAPDRQSGGENAQPIDDNEE